MLNCNICDLNGGWTDRKEGWTAVYGRKISPQNNSLIFHCMTTTKLSSVHTHNTSHNLWQYICHYRRCFIWHDLKCMTYYGCRYKRSNLWWLNLSNFTSWGVRTMYLRMWEISCWQSAQFIKYAPILWLYFG